MFTVFKSPTQIERRVINLENNVIAKKPGLSSRRPLTDRKVNNIENPQRAVKTKQSVKPKPLPVEEPDCCLCKEIKDDYSDVYCGLGEEVVSDLLDILSFRYNIRTPPPQMSNNEEEPKLEKIDKNLPTADELTADQITYLFANNYELAELPLPSFDDFMY